MTTHAARLRARAGSLAAKPAVRIVALAAVAVAALAGFLAVFLVSTRQTPSVLLERPVTIKRTLSTTAALFGDRIEAEVDVYSDDRTVEPGSVRVHTSFTPYRAADTRVDRERRDGVSLLQTRIVLDVPDAGLRASPGRRASLPLPTAHGDLPSREPDAECRDSLGTDPCRLAAATRLHRRPRRRGHRAATRPGIPAVAGAPAHTADRRRSDPRAGRSGPRRHGALASARLRRLPPPARSPRSSDCCSRWRHAAQLPDETAAP